MMEALEVDDRILHQDSFEIPRLLFVDLLNFRNQKYLQTKFHNAFLNYLKNIKDSTMRDFSVSGIQGIGKSFTLFYFMLSQLKEKDQSVHYIDLQVPGFDTEQFWKYSNQIKDGDFLIIDHVTPFNCHLISEIRKKLKVLLLSIENGFTASASGKSCIFGKKYQLDEEEFNQMWMAQNKSPDVQGIGKDVYKMCLESALMTPRLLHIFHFKLLCEGCTLITAFSQYRIQQRNEIEVCLKSEHPPLGEYENFLLHSRLLLSIVPKDGDIILSRRQFDALRIGINIFTIDVGSVTKDNLKEDSRFLEGGFEENDNYYKVPSLADFWRKRLPYNIHYVLECKDFNERLNIVFQLGGGTKEIENMVVAVQKEHYFMIIPCNAVFTTTYKEAQEDCLIPQVGQYHAELCNVYSVNIEDLLNFDTPFRRHKKPLAQCAMWIKEKVKSCPNETFILHPDISNLMGVDYFCKNRSFRKTDEAKQLKREDSLFLMQVATGRLHTGKAVGEALDVVKDVFAGENLTIHVVIIVATESQKEPFCLTKCEIQDASAINLFARVFTERIKGSHPLLHDFIHKVKNMNK
ncbi:hypothetical protein FSP39_002611 [Pinctada imbricata]|uniref:Uncharacterized protein n=1 Tax=Pinctada imbricata TaxID=66713 RepID=A0AA88Y2Q6_PINIB|nr:hypothetical protein FSP39_002611 [Pinctada imbricata]